LNPLFHLSTRIYDKEIPIVIQALTDMEKEFNAENYIMNPLISNYAHVYFCG
jgi:hypothetical protein